MSTGSDSNKLPVPYKPDAQKQGDISYHNAEWTSGKRGGGKVPADFEWHSNPKQYQEELGANVPPPNPKK
jgi:hypothetical protein